MRHGGVFALALALAAACGSDGDGSAKAPRGRRAPDKRAAHDEAADGEIADGEAADGEAADSDAACGDAAEKADGDVPEIGSHEEGIDAKVELVDELADILGTVEDLESAEAARPKIDALRKRATAIHAALKKLGRMDEDLTAEAMKRLLEPLGRFREAKESLPADPKVRKALGDYDVGMWAMGR